MFLTYLKLFDFAMSMIDGKNLSVFDFFIWIQDVQYTTQNALQPKTGEEGWSRESKHGEWVLAGRPASPLSCTKQFV